MRKNMDRIDIEIKNKLTVLLPNFIKKLDNVQCETYILNDSGLLGVGIERNSKTKIFERFNNIIMKDKTYVFNGKEINLLVLLLENSKSLNEFTKIAEDFVSGNINRRKLLCDNPYEWWETWKNLIGNKSVDNEIYTLLAELLIYKYIYDKDKTAIWNTLNTPTHDIETDIASYEVKSTLKKYETKINVSSEYQLKQGTNPIYLFFVRLEESLDGFSLEDLLNQFDKNKKEDLEDILSKIPKLDETHLRTAKYKVLEVLKYNIDDEFPLLNINYDNIPSNIKHIQYELSLDGLDCERITIF